MESSDLTDNDKSLKNLCILLGISNGGFVVCTYDEESTAEKIFRQLENKLLQQRIALRIIGSTIELSELERETVNLSKSDHPGKHTKIIFSAHWDEHIFKKAIRDYNSRRDFYYHKFETTLIIWIQRKALKWLLNEVPDFWRIRLGSFRFQKSNSPKRKAVKYKTSKYFKERFAWNFKISDQENLVNGFLLLMNYYDEHDEWTKSRACYVKSQMFHKIISDKNSINDEKMIIDINDLICELIQNGLDDPDSILHDVALEKCRYTSGSKRLFQPKYEHLIKSLYLKIGNAYFVKSQNHKKAEIIYEKILENTNFFKDRKIRLEVKKKLEKIKSK